MPLSKNLPAYDLEHAKALLEQVAAKVRVQKWFKKDWVVSVHYFPPAPAAPESVSMHVFKSNWYNETAQGIHFETHLSSKQFAESVVPVMLHLFHTPNIPGTSIKRIKVSKPVVDEAFETISNWDNYAFRVGKYGTQPFTCSLKVTPDTLVDGLVAEFTRMCGALGPIIDKSLAEALSAEKPGKARK